MSEYNKLSKKELVKVVEELRELVRDYSDGALDLAHHLSFTNEMLRMQYKPFAYRRAELMAYRLFNLEEIVKQESEEGKERMVGIDMSFYGGDGLHKNADAWEQKEEEGLPDINIEDMNIDQLVERIVTMVPYTSLYSDWIQKQKARIKAIESALEGKRKRDKVEFSVKIWREVLEGVKYLEEAVEGMRLILIFLEKEYSSESRKQPLIPK